RVRAEQQRHHVTLVVRRHRAREPHVHVLHRERPPSLGGCLLRPEKGPMILAMTDFSREREEMVERQLRRRGITEGHILEAFREVPREVFSGTNNVHLAYGDHPLPIEAGQTISQPYIVALMIQAAAIK